MITREKLHEYARVLYDFCEYPAVRYKILFSLLDIPYNDERLSVLHNEFLRSDIVEEMYQLQWDNGGWGFFKAKDYSVKAKSKRLFWGQNAVCSARKISKQSDAALVSHLQLYQPVQRVKVVFRGCCPMVTGTAE